MTKRGRVEDGLTKNMRGSCWVSCNMERTGKKYRMLLPQDRDLKLDHMHRNSLTNFKKIIRIYKPKLKRKSQKYPKLMKMLVLQKIIWQDK